MGMGTIDLFLPDTQVETQVRGAPRWAGGRMHGGVQTGVSVYMFAHQNGVCGEQAA